MPEAGDSFAAVLSLPSKYTWYIWPEFQTATNYRPWASKIRTKVIGSADGAGDMPKYFSGVNRLHGPYPRLASWSLCTGLASAKRVGPSVNPLVFLCIHICACVHMSLGWKMSWRWMELVCHWMWLFQNHFVERGQPAIPGLPGLLRKRPVIARFHRGVKAQEDSCFIWCLLNRSKDDSTSSFVVNYLHMSKFFLTFPGGK